MNSSLLKKYRFEATIVAGFLVLLLAAFLVPTRRHDEAPAPAAAVRPDDAPVALSLHAPPRLAGLARDPGQVPLSLDLASQGGRSVVLAGTKAPVALSFSRRRPIAFEGWAVDRGKAAGGVYLVIDGSKRIPAEYGVDRPDVARALSAPDERYVGFRVDVPPNVFAPGAHDLGVLVVDGAAKGYYSPLPQATIVIAN